MNALPTVSIGIPAYNEGKNIQSLLQSLIKQKELDIRIKEILVVSDGSSDDTEKKVKELKDRRIRFVDDGKRLGKSARMDYIFKSFRGDVLILIDADVVIKDSALITKTVKNAHLSKTGLAGINASPLAPQTSFERVIEAGVMVMKEVAKQWHNGNNYLAFKGCFLALDGKFARSISMPSSIVNNDAYLYFAAVQAGYSPAYLDKSKVYYRSPMTLADHMKQSSRYQSSENELRKHFTLDWDHHYKIPATVMLKSMMSSLLARPIGVLSYMGIFFYSKMNKQSNIRSTWSIAKSTKGKLSI
jgi:glycosyltransferase involved in cell wall biosynthesis